MIEVQDFRNWLDNSVTKEIFFVLKIRREAYVNQVLDGLPGVNEKFMVAFGERIGHINAYDELLNINYEDLEE